MLAIVNNYCADLSINKKRYNLRICRYAGEIPYFYQFIPFKKAPKTVISRVENYISIYLYSRWNEET